MPNKRQPIVVGIGEILWDMLPGGKRAGGAPINFVYHTVQLGAEGYAISAIGDDEPGREILRELDKNNIAYSIAKNTYPTGRVDVTLNNGIPAYTIVEDVAWDYLPVTAEAIDIIRKADAVCYGSLALRSPTSRATVKKLLSYTKPRAIRFFDINLRGNYYSRALLDELLQTATVFKINDDEIKIVRNLFNLDGNDEQACRQLLQNYNLDYLIFTAGEKYSIIYSPRETSFLPSPKVAVADTVGAGDAFSGAFVYSILTGKNMRQAHAEAVKISAYVCTRSGAWPQYPSLPKG